MGEKVQSEKIYVHTALFSDFNRAVYFKPEFFLVGRLDVFSFFPE